MLINGKKKQINYLQTGDQVLTLDYLKIVPTEMVIMLDKQTLKHGFNFVLIFLLIFNWFVSGQFYTFVTDSGHKISLTGLHLIPIVSPNNKMKYIAAREVQLGDQLHVLVTGHMKSSPIKNITIEIKKGYFAPLKLTG